MIQTDISRLTKGTEKLSLETNLRVPLLQKINIETQFGDKIIKDFHNWQNGCEIPGSIGPIVNCKVIKNCNITCDNPQIVKKIKRELIIELNKNCEKSKILHNLYDAGDSIYFIFPNNQEDVEFIINRLNVKEKANNELHIYDKSSDSNFNKLYPHINNPCTFQYLLTYCLDIRRSPGRPVLRTLAQFCSNENDERRLLELCSSQGSIEFNTLIRQSGISLIDLLIAFPSCKPTIASLITILPRLLPRAYSISNYKTHQWSNCLRFVYSLLKLEYHSEDIKFSRYGLCSGWLNSLNVGDNLKICLKEPSKFRLPPLFKPELDIVNCSLILIGPGTGVAPFMSFLHKIRYYLNKNENLNVQRVRRYLFYGSSNLTEEFLFSNELNLMKEEGILTDLVLCQSKGTSNLPKYVYDALKEKGSEIVKLILQKHVNYPTIIYSCGDVKNMSKQLWACLKEMIMLELACPLEKTLEILQQLRNDLILIEDVWS